MRAFSDSDSKIDVAYNSVPDGFNAITETQKQEVRNRYSSGEKFFIYVGSLQFTLTSVIFFNMAAFEEYQISVPKCRKLLAEWQTVLMYRATEKHFSKVCNMQRVKLKPKLRKAKRSGLNILSSLGS